MSAFFAARLRQSQIRAGFRRDVANTMNPRGSSILYENAEYRRWHERGRAHRKNGYLRCICSSDSHYSVWLPYLGFRELNEGEQTVTAPYDYHIGVDYHKSYSHLVVQDSAGKRHCDPAA